MKFSIMFIGLISDTHGIFDEPFRQFLEPVDEIWHAGDFGGIQTAEAIAAFKPLKGVYGNCDGYDVRLDYPLYQLFDCEGLKVLMTHIGGYPGRYDPRARALIDECDGMIQDALTEDEQKAFKSLLIKIFNHVND